MNIEGRTVWQQAAGDTNRDYAELCLRWDVILNGPAKYGPWPNCKPLLQADGWTPRKITDLERFSERMKDGDLIVLRLGTSQVCGVGEVVGAYEWNDHFGDVDGWDLQHVRRVRWLWKRQDAAEAPTFSPWALKQGDTTQLLRADGPVRDWLSTLPVENASYQRSLVQLPPTGEAAEVSLEAISDFLFDHGVASFSITSLVNEMGELERIAKWYKRARHKPSEHETVAYLVVPLLRALGWTPQRMAVEWNNVDVALFERLPRADDNLKIVVEAKKMDDSCLTAYSQAENYARGKDSCHRLVVTDGLRYGIYVRKRLDPFRLHAYMNLERLRNRYSVYECAGVKEALLGMTPEWHGPDAN